MPTLLKYKPYQLVLKVRVPDGGTVPELTKAAVKVPLLARTLLADPGNEGPTQLMARRDRMLLELRAAVPRDYDADQLFTDISVELHRLGWAVES